MMMNDLSLNWPLWQLLLQLLLARSRLDAQSQLVSDSHRRSQTAARALFQRYVNAVARSR